MAFPAQHTGPPLANLLKRREKQDALSGLKEKVIKEKEFGYFSFVALVFIFSREVDGDKNALSHVCKSVQQEVIKQKGDLRLCTDLYLKLSDYVSCPYVGQQERASLVNLVLGREGREVSAADIDELEPHFAFVDWRGKEASYLLKRKRLQPVYFA